MSVTEQLAQHIASASFDAMPPAMAAFVNGVAGHVLDYER